MKSLIFTILATLTAHVVDARTWIIKENGSGDAFTIQAGIDSASVGDTVLVEPGTYFEHPNFSGKDIVLKSSMGPGATTLDGSLRDELWVVAFNDGESVAAVLDGFTITRGKGGISVRDSEATIVNNVIEQNLGAGGILCSTSSGPVPLSVVIRDNLIQENTALQGGGVCVSGFYVPEITSNTFLNNEVTFGDGGGISLVPDVPGAKIIGNYFEGNIAADHGGGMYVGCSIPGSSGFEVAWNIVVRNVANGRAPDFHAGGGIWVGADDAWVHHNTLVGNSGSADATGSGGGLALVEAGTPLVEQNIVAYSSPTGKGIVCIFTTPVLSNNLVWENRPENLDPVCWELWQGNGNIVANPGFCKVEQDDYSLGELSPAFTHPAGPLGAISEPGCDGGTPTITTTWGSLKWKFTKSGQSEK